MGRYLRVPKAKQDRSENVRMKHLLAGKNKINNRLCALLQMSSICKLTSNNNSNILHTALFVQITVSLLHPKKNDHELFYESDYLIK
jgi:hypothetical protein